MNENTDTAEKKKGYGCLLGCGGSVLFLAVLWYIGAYVIFEGDTGTRLGRLIQDAGPQKVRDWAQQQINAAKIARAGKPEQKPERLPIPYFLEQENLQKFSRAEVALVMVFPPLDEDGKYYVFIGMYAPIWEKHALYIGDDTIIGKVIGTRSKKIADGIWYESLGGK